MECNHLPKVYIVLVNYNGWLDTIECLESLIKLDYTNFVVVVVDNASTDNSVYFIKEWSKRNIDYNFSLSSLSKKLAYPPVQNPIESTFIDDKDIGSFKLDKERIIFINSKENLGFAGGNNVGTRFALNQGNADFIWYLNNDTVVEKNSLSELVTSFRNYLNKGNKLGILGSKLKYYHKPAIIQAIGGVYNPWFATVKHVGGHETDLGQYDQSPDSIHLNYVVGASMFVSSDFIEQVGMMAEDYFLYYEEIDWVLRGQRKGYTFSYCPASIVFHKEGASIGTDSEKKVKSELSDYYDLRNRLKITRRYFPKYLPVVYFLMFGVLLNRLRRGQFKRIPMILKIIFNSKAD